MIRWGLAGGSDIAATRMIPAMRALGQPICAVASSTLASALFGFCCNAFLSCKIAEVASLFAR